MGENSYPRRVTLFPDGVYRWRARINRAQHRKALGILIGGCGLFCLLLAALGVPAGSFRDALPFTGTAALIMAVVLGVCLLDYRFNGNGWQAYEMSDKALHFVSGGSADTLVAYGDICRLRIVDAQDLFEVKTAILLVPFFVPHEDFAKVQQYILQRIPDRTRIEYR